MRSYTHDAVRSVALAFAVSTVGCSGGGAGPGGTSPSATQPSPARSAASGSVRFSVSLPAANANVSAFRNRRRYDVSPATASVTITLASVNGSAPSGRQTPVVIDFLPTSPNCGPATGGKDYLTCSVTFAAPAGNDVFTAKAYSDFDAGGVQLSSGSAQADVPASGTVAAPLTLNGIVAGISLAAAAPLLPVGVKTPFRIFVIATDASGAAILGGDPFASPIALSVSDPDDATTLAAMSLAAPSASISGSYDGTTGLAPHDVTISASAANVAPSAVEAVTLHVDDERGWVNGATYTFTGTQSAQVVPPSGTPPPATVSATKTVNTIVTGGTFDRQTNLIDVHAVTSTTPSGSSTASSSTADEYYAYNDLGSPVNVDYVGENLVTAGGSTQTIVENAESIYDKLPEAAGQLWSNGGNYRSTYVAATGDQNPSQQYNANDGAYYFQDTFANKQTATATANADGSGSYAYGPYADGSFHTWALAAPIAGSSVSISETISPEGGGASSSTANVTNWYPGGTFPARPLTDAYSDAGPVTVPVACGVAAAYATKADEIDENYGIVDPIVGSISTMTRRDFVENGIGRVCTLSTSTQQYYYGIGNAATEADGTPLIFFGSLLYEVQNQSASGLQSYALAGKTGAVRTEKR